MGGAELDDLTIGRAQRGDVEAQATVLARHSRLLRYLVSRTAGSAETDDLMQDLYARILAVLPRYRLDGEACLTTWVFTVAHHWLVSQRRRPHLALVSTEETAEVVDVQPRPDEACASAELRRRLDAAIAELPAPLRRVFVMAQVLGQPLDAISLAEGVPLGTVKSRLHRARATLVLDLGGLLDEEPGGGRG